MTSDDTTSDVMTSEMPPSDTSCDSSTTPSRDSLAARELPLLIDTPPEWAHEVLKDPVNLLIDHAHLEKKAAQNALQLLHQWPEQSPPTEWTEALSEINRDESQHLTLVLRILHRRGGELTRSHRNPYAQTLKEGVRNGTHPGELVDKLLTSSLIEARSCERFRLLAEHTEDQELRKLYTGLWSSEHDHYRVFLQLALHIEREEEVLTRWQWWLEKEREIIASQDFAATMHSWIKNSSDNTNGSLVSCP